MQKFVHIVYIFHPDMGYDINLMVQHLNGRFENTIITSADVSMWNETEESIKLKDCLFEKKNNCKIIRLPFLKLNKSNTVPFIRGMRKTLRKLKPDFSFLHGIESHAFVFGLPAVLTHGGSVGLDTHTLYNQIENASFIWKAYVNLILKPFWIKKINKLKIPVFYTAKENRHFLIEFLGINETLMHSNEIATNLDIFYPFKDQETMIKLGLKADEKNIFYIGKFDSFKKPHLILEALKTGGDKVPFPIHVIMAGPKNSAYFKDFFTPLPQINNVRFSIFDSLPNNELYKYYSLADVVVFPEQNTLSALDAQACKAPVIMMDDETNRERLKEGGLLYEQGNMPNLYDKIIKFLSDDQLRVNLKENGFKYISEKYNYQKTMEKVVRVLEGERKQ